MVMKDPEVASSIALGDLSVPLEYICPQCRGVKATQGPKCPKCLGLGTIPSPQGVTILHLVHRHGSQR